MRRVRTPVILLPAFVIFLLITSCDAQPPELQQVYWQLHVTNDVVRDRVHETVSLWVQAEDEDGPDDLEYIYLIHDEAELMWEISAEHWQEAEQQGVTWYGSNSIVQAGLSDFPRGEYRVLILDTAGERDERSMYISLQKNIAETAEPPEAAAEEGELTVKNAAFGFTLFGYNEAGEFIGSIKDRSAPIPFEELESKIPGISGFSIYSYNLDEGYGLISGRYEYVPLGP